MGGMGTLQPPRGQTTETTPRRNDHCLMALSPSCPLASNVHEEVKSTEREDTGRPRADALKSGACFHVSVWQSSLSSSPLPRHVRSRLTGERPQQTHLSPQVVHQPGIVIMTGLHLPLSGST